MNFIEKLFGGAKGDGFNQRQREALVDLLILCQYADNVLRLSEEELIKSKLQELKWDSAKPLDYYMNEAVARVRDARASAEAQMDFISYISSRLETNAVRQRALSIMGSVFRADRQRTEREIALQKQIQSALERSHKSS
ncbi:MAG: hypothetical protein SFY80_11425 [Verrucomicrobiota bacterium]|nr:hypothetical protein [Verrucomicrobiota bacterium]